MDGDGSVLLRRTCGYMPSSNFDFTVCSKTNEVYFTFITDCTVTLPGWTAEWTEVGDGEEECTATLPESLYKYLSFS